MEIVQKAIETRQSCISDLQERYKVHKCRYGVEFSTSNSSISLFDHWSSEDCNAVHSFFQDVISSEDCNTVHSQPLQDDVE